MPATLHVNRRHLELAPYLADVEQLPDHLMLAAELGPTRREAAAIEARIRSSCDRIQQVAPQSHRRGAESGIDDGTVDRVLRLLEGGASINQAGRDLEIKPHVVSRIASRGRPKVNRCRTCGGRSRTPHCSVCSAENLRRDPLFGLGDRTRSVVEATGIHPDQSSDPSAPTLKIPQTGWRVCVVIGPPESGKTLAVRDFMASRGGVARFPKWPTHESILEHFSRVPTIEEICQVLRAVGLSNPVDWHREYRQLSSSQRFRADLAYTITRHDCRQTVAVDDFAAPLDDPTGRQLAGDVGRAIRGGRLGKCRQFLAVTNRKTIARAFRADVICDLSQSTKGTDKQHNQPSSKN